MMPHRGNSPRSSALSRWVRGTGVAVVLAATMVAPSANAKDAGDKPRPVGTQRKGERQLGEKRRPVLEKAAASRAREERALRVQMQIPGRLRRILARKIDRRIGRNIAAARKLRDEAIGLLVKFIKEAPETSRALPEALMRLGELRFEEARDDFLASFKRWQKLPPENRAESDGPPKPDYHVARGLFLRVLKRHKSFPDYDLALYVDGFLASEEGKHDEALGRFNKILAWFPKSRFVPDAHMVRAEYEFTKDYPDYAVALAEYEKVLTFKGSDLHDIANFKAAWCLWRLNRRDEAARRFLKVFKATDDALARGAGNRKAELGELQKEALKNLVAVFVEDEKNSAEDMHRFLVKAGGARFAGRIVGALADALYEQAHYERGIEAYRLLLRLEPRSPKAYKHRLAVAQGFSTMERWKGLAKAYEVTLREHTRPPKQPAGKQATAKAQSSAASKRGGQESPSASTTWKASAWVRTQDPKVVAAAEAAIEKQLWADAVGLHAKAQADKTSRSEFEGAARLYAVYLQRFEGADRAYEAHFNRAEIYFYRLDDVNEAAKHYLAAVRLKPKGELSHDALVRALTALEESRANELKADKAAGRKPKETATDRQMTEAMELFVATYPKDPSIPTLLFRQGRLYYDFAVYDPAVRQLGLLVEKYPQHPKAREAGEMILDAFNKGEDYANIETWARRLKKAPAFAKAEDQARLDELIVGAVFKQGEGLAKAGKHAAAAAAYLRAAREFPKEPRAAKAAVNAEVEARRAADLKTLVAAAALLQQHHPTSSEAPIGLWVAATTHQQVGLFGRAADYHAKIAESHPKYEHHKDAAFNAVLLRTTVKKNDAAVKSGTVFLRRYRRDALAPEVTFLMGKAHEQGKRLGKAAALYAKYAFTAPTPSARVEALVRLAQVRVAQKRESQATRALRRAEREAKRAGKRLDAKGRYFAAKAQYLLAERILARYDKVKIQGSVPRIKAALKKKARLLKDSAKTFTETAKLGVAEWTTASLYQVGFIFESFARALLDSPPPPGLNSRAQEAYQIEVDRYAIPFEERAIEAYESGWKKALELGIFNEWTAKMRAALGRLTSETYPPLVETGFRLRSRGPSPLPDLIEAERRTKSGRSKTYLMVVSRAGTRQLEGEAAESSKGGKAPAKGNGASTEDDRKGDEKGAAR